VEGKTHTQDVLVETDPDHPKGPWLEAESFFGGEEFDGEEEIEERNG
jgi:hypothetical protein